MNAHVEVRTPPVALDLLALTKPGIVAMTALTAAGGMGLAPERIEPTRAAAALIGTSLCVASANVFNMYLERNSDRLMQRTEARPLAQGRMSQSLALTFGASLGLLALTLLALLDRPITAMLGAFGLIVYVLLYTPLKAITPHALLVGCVAGAVPPAMGWSAAAGTIGPAALALPALLFVWQIPHFLAIALFRKHDYARAGIRAASVVYRQTVVRRMMIASSAALVLVSLAPIPMGLAGLPFGAVALGAGAWMLWLCWTSIAPDVEAWARRVFQASLVYLPVLAIGMIVDVLTR